MNVKVAQFVRGFGEDEVLQHLRAANDSGGATGLYGGAEPPTGTDPALSLSGLCRCRLPLGMNPVAGMGSDCIDDWLKDHFDCNGLPASLAE